MVEPTSLAGEYLTFRVGDAEYGMDILRIQEIRSYEQPTRIAGAPSLLKGMLNLRGVLVPIIDLRIVMGVACPYSAFTVVVVVRIGTTTIGVVVDSVSDVKNVMSHQVRPVDGYPHPDTLMHVIAVANVDESDVALVDITALTERLYQSIQGVMS